jgi:hypothetical protein
MEELNKEHNPGTVIENTTNSTVENNHVAQDPEPAFSDEEEESPLRLVICYINYKYNIYYIYVAYINFFTEGL